MKEVFIVLCNNCGFENKSSAVVCEKCEKNLSSKKLKCKKCGYLNENRLNKCLNCGFNLNASDLVNEKNKTNINVNKKLNCIIFSIFSIIFTFVIPLTIIFILSLIEDSSGITFIENNMFLLILLILGMLSFLASIFLSTLFTKLLVRNVCNLKKYNLVSLYISLIIIIFGLLFYSVSSAQIVLKLFGSLKVVDWILSRKLLIKEKMSFSKKTLYVYSGTVVVVLIISLVIMPTDLNKKLFLKIGNTDFSSKETYVNLINEYNKINNKKVNYFHKLSNKELNMIDNLYIDDSFSNDDIKKLSNLTELSISDRAIISSDLDFSNLKKLNTLDIFSKNLKSLKLPSNSNLEELIVYSLLDELNLSDKNIKSYSVSAKNIYFNDNFFDLNDNSLISYRSKNSCFNKLLFGNKSIYLNNDNVMCVNLKSKQVTLYDFMNVSNIKGDNLKIILKNSEGVEITGDYVLDDKFYGYILIYDVDDNLLFRGNLDVRV